MKITAFAAFRANCVYSYLNCWRDELFDNCSSLAKQMLIENNLTGCMIHPFFTYFVHINWQNRITHQNLSVNIDVYDVYLITCRHGRRTARSHIIYCGRFETVVLFRVCISIFFLNNSKIEKLTRLLLTASWVTKSTNAWFHMVAIGYQCWPLV